MKQYTEEQLFDPKVRIEIYKQALKDWRTPWIFKTESCSVYTLYGFCVYFERVFKSRIGADDFLLFELIKLKTNDESIWWYWFTETGLTRKGRRARRKALRQAIQICKQKIKQNG